MKKILAQVTAVLFVAIAVAWTFRYQVLDSGELNVLLLDRWTQNVYLVAPTTVSRELRRNKVRWDNNYVTSLHLLETP
jgi:hypothetical protein